MLICAIEILNIIIIIIIIIIIHGGDFLCFLFMNYYWVWEVPFMCQIIDVFDTVWWSLCSGPQLPLAGSVAMDNSSPLVLLPS